MPWGYIAYVEGVAGVSADAMAAFNVLRCCGVAVPIFCGPPTEVCGVTGRNLGRDIVFVDIDVDVVIDIDPRQLLLNDALSSFTLMACKLAMSVRCSVWKVHDAGMSIGSAFTVTRSAGQQVRLFDR